MTLNTLINAGIGGLLMLVLTLWPLMAGADVAMHEPHENSGLERVEPTAKGLNKRVAGQSTHVPHCDPGPDCTAPGFIESAPQTEPSYPAFKTDFPTMSNAFLTTDASFDPPPPRGRA